MRTHVSNGRKPVLTTAVSLFFVVVTGATAYCKPVDPNENTETVRFNTAPLLATTAPIGPSAIAAGDLNGDGEADLVYITTGAQVVVRLSEGHHAFAPEVLYSTGFTLAQTILIADVNGDGKPDLVVGSFLPVVGQGFISVLLGLGDGTFGQPITSGANSLGVNSIVTAAAGDFNQDGKIDLIAYTSAGLTLFEGDGKGHFQLSWSSSSSNVRVPAHLIVADLDLSGHLSFVVSDVLSATVTVYLGRGDGTFASPVTYSGPNVPILVDSGLDGISCGAVTDMNGDGIPDLVLSDFNNHIDFLLGNGDGTFRYAPPTTGASFGDVGTSSGGIAAVRDFNHDGIPDIVVTTSNGLDVFLGKGDLSFEDPTTYPTTDGFPSLAIDDFDGDGNLDIAAAAFTFNTGITVLFGKSDGTFRSPQAFDLRAPIGDVKALFVGDEHTPEIIVGTTRPTVTVLRGSENGKFRVSTDISPAPPGFGSRLAVGDFAGDGILDAVLAPTFGSSIYIQLGTDNGNFQPPLPIPYFLIGSEPTLFVGDFNRDGKDDLGLVEGQSITILLGKGDGTFQPPIHTPTVNLLGGTPVVADFNHDGIPDIAFADGSVFLGNGDGSFRASNVSLLPFSGRDVATGDLDGDGNLDLVFTIFSSNFVVIEYGKGDGTFSTPVQIPTHTQEPFVAVGDMNHDGIDDLVLSGGAAVTVMLANGDRTFQPGIDFAAGPAPGKPVIADLNGDFYPDLIIPNYGANAIQEVVVLLNRSGDRDAPHELQ